MIIALGTADAQYESLYLNLVVSDVSIDCMLAENQPYQINPIFASAAPEQILWPSTCCASDIFVTVHSG